jgi:hypothetical protein
MSATPGHLAFIKQVRAVVKYAGLDPEMTLSEFRDVAHLVVALFYQKFYAEKPLLFIDRPSQQDDLEYNMDLILQSLREKLRNPALDEVTGQAVCLGQPRALGVIVGIYSVLLDEIQESVDDLPSSSSTNPMRAKKQRSGQTAERTQAAERGVMSDGDVVEQLRKRLQRLERKLTRRIRQENKQGGPQVGQPLMQPGAPRDLESSLKCAREQITSLLNIAFNISDEKLIGNNEENNVLFSFFSIFTKNNCLSPSFIKWIC